MSPDNKSEVRINEVYRDAIQSLMGTRPSAEEIIEAHGHAHEIGTATMQTAGGTFFDIPAKHGRDEWDFNEKILSAFGKEGVTQTALIRNDCLFGYRPQPFDVVKATVEEFAGMGVNIFQNFHGLNYVPAMEGVAEAVRQVREEKGLRVEAAGTICIEDNDNVTVENCLRTAEQLLKTHSRLYFKSASGVTSPDFNARLFEAVAQEFGDVPIDLHIHNTYGMAAGSYMAAIQACVEHGVSIGVDCQHPALSGSTAHLNMLKLTSMMRNSPSQSVQEAAPHLNIAAIEEDMDSLLMLRYRYRDTESRYKLELLQAMKEARAPGGASATLKSIPGLVDNLKVKLGTDDWDQIQIAIYETQKGLLKDYGDPTQVTPYALTTTNGAAFKAVGMPNFHPDVAYYLAGGLGPVPDSASPELIEQAKKEILASGQELPGDYLPALEREDALPAAIEALKNAGMEESPTQRQAVTAATMKGGVAHVLAVASGTNTPLAKPDLPDYSKPLSEAPKTALTGLRKSWIEADRPGLGQSDKSMRMRSFVKELGGIESIFLMAQRALHVRQMRDGWEQFPVGNEFQQQGWEANNLVEIKEFLDKDVPRAIRNSVIGNENPVHRKQAMELLEQIFDERSDDLLAYVQDLTMGMETPALSVDATADLS